VPRADAERARRLRHEPGRGRGLGRCEEERLARRFGPLRDEDEPARAVVHVDPGQGTVPEGEREPRPGDPEEEQVLPVARPHDPRLPVTRHGLRGTGGLRVAGLPDDTSRSLLTVRAYPRGAWSHERLASFHLPPASRQRSTASHRSSRTTNRTTIAMTATTTTTRA